MPGVPGVPWGTVDGKNFATPGPPAVDGKNEETPGAPGAQILSKFWFLVVLRGPGGPGAITNRRGMKKQARRLIFVIFGWIYEGFMPIFDF